VKCAKCGADNREGRKFCAKCATPLVRLCPRCGAQNEPYEDFCGECAASLAQTPGAPTKKPNEVPIRSVEAPGAENFDGERKTVTALFADIKGSMELMEDLDPEEARAIVDPALKLMIDAVHRYDGYIVQSTGDGIFALFGAPVAHEDHPQRALYAALRMQEELRRYSDKLLAEGRAPLEIRVGVNTGEVVVRSLTTGSGKTEYTPIGHTTNLAARMEAVAATGSIAITEHTRRLVEGYFALNSRGPTKVKGVTEPVNVYEVMGPGPLRTKLEVSRARGFSRFVGRESDMQTLDAALEQAQAGNGQVVGIVAEAGTGKSRLCFEFLECCRARAMNVLTGRAVAHGKNIPYLPMLEVFRGYYGISETDSAQAVREKIAGRLLLTDESLRELLPVVFEFFGVTDPEHLPPRMDPEAKLRQLFAVLRKEMRAGKAANRLVILIEDLHWMDAGSESFLEQWVDAIAGSRSLLIVNFRPEYHPKWTSKSYYRQIPLAPLGPEAVRAMLVDLLGNDVSIEGLAKSIYARAAGNPFFTEEAVQSLIESGALEGTRGSYRLVKPIEQLQVPPTVQALLAARIDRLGEREKFVLQSAAVIGNDFSEPILRRVVNELSHSLLSETELGSALRVLKDGDFILEQSLYPVSEYTFKHPLTQEVALNAQLKERRRRVHAAAAGALEEAHAGRLDETAALLAHHHEEAGDALAAARWHQRAAEWAGITNAAESLRHWERVRSLVRTLPHTSGTLELGATACWRALSLGWRLGTPTSEAAGMFEEGRELAEDSGDVRTLAALHGQYGIMLGAVGGDVDEWVRYSREATRLADQTEDQGLQFAECGVLAFACAQAGHLWEGIEVCGTACQCPPADLALGAEFVGASPFLSILTAQAWMLCRLGRINKAAAVWERAEAQVRARGENELLTALGRVRVELDSIFAFPAAARDHARGALEAGEKVGTPTARMNGLLALGIAHRLNKQWGEAVAVLQEVVGGATGGIYRFSEGWIRAELAEALLGRGDLDGAEHEAQAAVRAAYAQHARCDEIHANLALAHTQFQRADAQALERVLQALGRAQELIDETGARAWQPEVHECRAQLARLRRDASASRQELDGARRLYAEMGATAQIERLAREIDGGGRQASLAEPGAES
jgi:class 3 adenylate cyclase/tetratricopeptide (TPR) repeat protein